MKNREAILSKREFLQATLGWNTNLVEGKKKEVKSNNKTKIKKQKL